MVHILDRENTILNRFIAEIRDSRIQKDRMRFRRNHERFGEEMAYEISKSFNYSPRTVETPRGEAEVMLPDEEIVLATILRAGIPFHQGFLNYFDDASCAFVSAYRRYSKDGTFNIRVEYVSAGDLTDKTLLLVDPMLATGSSLVLAYEALVERKGWPAKLHVAAGIASEEGVEYALRHLPAADTTIWCGSVDLELTVHSYIVPGLGDAELYWMNCNSGLPVAIRRARPEELGQIMEIVADAAAFMHANGNPGQWRDGYPGRERIAADIAGGYSHAAIDATGTMVATFCFMPSPEPNYATIRDGAWQDGSPYHVIHRLACAVRGQGIAARCMAWCLEQDRHLRADTHRDNIPMQRLLLRFGFRPVGTVFVEDGTPRIAFEHSDNFSTKQ